MELLVRSRDVFTGSTDLEELHTLPDFPVFMGTVEHPRSDDLVADMTWEISKSSGALQLKYLIPLEVLYQAQHNAAIGGIWAEHHAAFAKFVHGVNPAAVLEIGGATGILASNYARLVKIPWTIVEPNPVLIEGCDARVIKGFFDDTFSFDGPFDTVVHSHVFEHIYEPDAFVRNLAGLIPLGANMVFSLPNIQAMVERHFTNGLNFEHSVFITEPYVEYLLSKHGFRTERKELFLEDHSIFYSTVRDPSVSPISLPPGLYHHNKAIYEDFVAFHRRLIDEINERMRDLSGPFYLFGAHIFSQYLIAYGLDTSRIVSLIDNDARKQGKRLYGTDLMVQSPMVLAAEERPVVILRAAGYNDEIKADISANINASTIFLE